MSAWMLSMAAGIGVVACLPTLSAALPWAAVPLASIVLCELGRRAWPSHGWRRAALHALAFALGIVWGTGYGYWLRGALLPVALEQQPLTLTGTVDGIVESYADAADDTPAAAQPSSALPLSGSPVSPRAPPTRRWAFRVDGCMRGPHACGVALPRVMLSVYRSTLQPAAGERWQLRVKLKRPRGFANPGGFDYEAWLVAQRIGAVGYVIDEALSAASPASNRRLAPAPAWSADRWREAVLKRLEQRAGLQHRDLLAGLLIGDGSGISAAAWETFRVTGTVHLFVVSGLQIAFTGGLALWLARLWWRSPWGRSRRRDYWLGLAPALLVATAYALLAGFGLPIQRALVMFACVVGALALQREIGVEAWSLALLLVLLGNPLAVLDAGFWFSFGAVAVLLMCASERHRRAAAGLRGLGAGMRAWGRVQVALFVGALPLSLAVAGQITLLALPANALAVPWSTLATMPLAFLALLCEVIAPAWADLPWRLADLTLRVLWRYLCWLQQWGDVATWRPPGSGVVGLCCATACALLLLLPRGMPGRAWAWLLLLPVGWPPLERIAPGDCRVTVIDVGQGLSVLVETTGHRLLYDTGPPFGPERSVAELTVAPLLRQRGVRALDAVVISHGDNDHAGGWPTIAAQFDVRELLLGEPLAGARFPGAVLPPGRPAGSPQSAGQSRVGPSRSASAPPARAPPLAQRCHAGIGWSWDGVAFELLHPPADRAVDGNNASCVLLVRATGATILLPGDIERSAEYALYERLPAVDILLVPHHGSRTSSTVAFVARTRPRHGVFSTGYRNRFGHPHASVVERYVRQGTSLANTADSGALIFDVRGGRVAHVERWREHAVHYWQ